MHAFKEIVAEQCVFGDAPNQATLKGINIVNPLANIDAGPKEILIDIGDGQAIEIDTRVTGKDARKE